MSLIDWGEVPGWAKYVAQDPDGSWWAFECEPECEECDGVWDAPGHSTRLDWDLDGEGKCYAGAEPFRVGDVYMDSEGQGPWRYVGYYEGTMVCCCGAETRRYRPDGEAIGYGPSLVLGVRRGVDIQLKDVIIGRAFVYRGTVYIRLGSGMGYCVRDKRVRAFYGDTKVRSFVVRVSDTVAAIHGDRGLVERLPDGSCMFGSCVVDGVVYA